MIDLKKCTTTIAVLTVLTWTSCTRAQMQDAASGLPIPDATRALLEEARHARLATLQPASKEITAGCAPQPLPVQPQGDTWSAVVDDAFLGLSSRFRITAWRYPCPDGRDHQLLVTLSPTHGATNILGNFHVRQGSRDYNVQAVINDSLRSLGGNLNAPVTVMMSFIGSPSNTYDDDAALKLIYIPLGVDTVEIEIPAVNPQGGNDDDTTPDFRIDGRVRGSYTVAGQSGHGLLFDVVDTPTQRGLYGAWFTTSPMAEEADRPIWFTFGGSIEGNTSSLDVYRTTDQRFAESMPVNTQPIGTATVLFESCTTALVSYDLEAYDRQGSFTLQRITPAPEGCAED